jgi:hypothetical protein
MRPSDTLSLMRFAIAIPMEPKPSQKPYPPLAAVIPKLG